MTTDPAPPAPDAQGGRRPLDHFAIADRLFGDVERGDIDDLRRLYHPEARIWHNFDQRDQTVEENLRTLGWMCRAALRPLLRGRAPRAARRRLPAAARAARPDPDG